MQTKTWFIWMATISMAGMLTAGAAEPPPLDLDKFVGQPVEGHANLVWKRVEVLIDSPDCADRLWRTKFVMKRNAERSRASVAAFDRLPQTFFPSFRRSSKVRPMWSIA